jgi:hypothetical protein
MDTNDYFYVNLNTLSQIEEYDKLGLKNIDNELKLVVDKGSYISFITRRYNGYDRLTVINYLKDFINKLEKYVDLLVKGNLEDYAKVIIPIIKTALIGLTNLKTTYIDDSNIVSEISLIIIKLESFVQQLNEITIVLNCVNDERS